MKKGELFLFIWLVDLSSLWEPGERDLRRQPQLKQESYQIKVGGHDSPRERKRKL